MLSQERAAVKEAWENRNNLLKQCTDIQVMNDSAVIHTGCVCNTTVNWQLQF